MLGSVDFAVGESHEKPGDDETEGRDGLPWTGEVVIIKLGLASVSP
jgi:hypothetical protein